MYQNIAIPISDGRKMLTLSVNLEKAYNTGGKEIAKALSRTIILYQIDEHWKQHLREMDDLRTSVQNAAYEQKDPLVVYKLESYNLFASMLEDLNKDVLSFLLRAFVPLRDENEARPAQAPRRKTDMSQMISGLGTAMWTTLCGLVASIGLKALDAVLLGRLVNLIDAKFNEADTIITRQTLQTEVRQARTKITQVSGERTGAAPLRTAGSAKTNRAGNGQVPDQSGTKAQSGTQPKRLTDETQTAETSSQTTETSLQTAEISSQTTEPGGRTCREKIRGHPHSRMLRSTSLLSLM